MNTQKDIEAAKVYAYCDGTYEDIDWGYGCRFKSFLAGINHERKANEELVKDLEWAIRIIDYGIKSSRLDSKYHENLEAIKGKFKN